MFDTVFILVAVLDVFQGKVHSRLLTTQILYPMEMLTFSCLIT